MKYLIVNGDDLGLSPGVNRGIIEAHERGILTSASLIVDMPWSEDAAARVHDAPALSVGLHVNLAAGDPDIASQLDAQATRFTELVGRPPAHIDSHHHDHRHADLLPHFVALAAAFAAPLRGHSPIASVTSFYGRWGGESHPEQIGVQGLARILDREVTARVTELACHPGYVDEQLRSSYAIERELELATLCDRRLPAIVRERDMELIGSAEAARMMGPSVASG